MEVMTQRNWIPVFNKYSCIFYREGAIFIYGTRNSTDVEFGCLTNCDRTFINVNYNGPSDWLVAKDGYVTGRGAMPPRILESYDEGETKDAKQFNIQMDLIETATSDRPLTKHKVDTYEDQQPGNVIAIQKDKTIRETHTWVAMYEVGDIKPGEVFRIVGASDGFLLTRKVDKRKMEFCSDVVKTDPAMLKKLEQAGIFKAADIVEGLQTVKKPYFRDCSELTKLPSSFDDFNLSAKAITIVSKGIDKGINVTPFLTGTVEATDGMLDALSNNLFDWTPLLGSEINAEQCDQLASAINLTLPVKDYITDGNYNKIMEDVDAWEYIAAMDGIKEGDRKFVKTLYAYNAEIDAEDVFKSFYSFWLNRMGLCNVLEDLSFYGMVIDETIEIPWHILRSSSKREIARYLLLDFFTTPYGADWNLELPIFLDNLTSVIFDANKGLLLKKGNATYVRDLNSIAAYDKDFVCLWRAINVNEKIYCYGVAV